MPSSIGPAESFEATRSRSDSPTSHIVEPGKTLAKAAATIKNVDVIIPGHSTTMTPADLKEYADFNNDFITWVQMEIRANKSVDEAAMDYKIPEKYKGYTVSTFFGGIKGNIQTAYNELKK